MRKITILFLFVSLISKANVYYVATNGNDTNDGTALTSPFKTIAKATGLVVAGDQIYVREGTYTLASAITISGNGTVNTPIILEGYQGERAVFTGREITLSGSYWHFKGIDVYKSNTVGMLVKGAYNTIEFCRFYENNNSGLQLSNGAHDNRIINCDSYYNTDVNHADADGFACKMSVGSNNYYYGCRSWCNVDDGWDGYLRGSDNVSNMCENCWTWRNGYEKDGKDWGYHANGNGFKMGGYDAPTPILRHNFTLRNCVAFDNKANGFDQNRNAGTMIIQNCTGFRNNKYIDYGTDGIINGANFSVTVALASGKTCTVVNCVSYNGPVNLASFVSQTTNSWLSPFTVTEDDFVSIDTTGVSGPRGSDGSLPKLNFMRLKEGSDLINAGTNIGHSYIGSAPDLGAFEFDNSGSGTINPLNKELYPFFAGENLVINLNQKFSGAMTCKLFNLNGKAAFQSELNSEATQIDCNGLSKGFYILELSNREGRFVSKVVK